MKQTNFFNISVPELGDRPDITQVSNAISNLEDALAGTMEYMNASVNNKVLTLTSATRKTKRTGYHTGLTCVFTSGVKIDIGGITSVIVDNLPAKPAELKFIIDADDSAIVVFDGTRFAFKHAPMPRSNAIDSSSEHFIATSRAVKTLNDNKAEKTVQVVAGNGLTGGGDLTSNKTINVVSADAGIVVNADNIKLNVVNAINSTDAIRPATANAVKTAYDKGVEGLNKANEAVSLANSNNTAMDNKKVNRSGDTMTGQLKFSHADAIRLNNQHFILSRDTYTGVSNSTGSPIAQFNEDRTTNFHGVVKISNGTVYHTGNKPSKTDVGLSNVNNWTATSSTSDSATDKYATAGAVKQAYDRASSALTEADKKVNKAGDTMTGRLVAKELQISGTEPGLMNSVGGNLIRNSSSDANITVVGNIKGKTIIDSLSNPTVRVGSTTTEQTIYHTGNKPSKADVGLGSVSDFPVTSSVSDSSNSKYATAGAVKQAYDRASSGINEANTKVSKSGDTMTGALNMGVNNVVFQADDSGDINFNNANGTQKAKVYTSGTSEGLILVGGATGSGNLTIKSGGNGVFTGTATATKFLGPLQGNADTATSSTKLTTARQINGTNFDGTANITTANWGTARNITVGNTTKSVNGSGNVSFSASEIGYTPLKTLTEQVDSGFYFGQIRSGNTAGAPTSGSQAFILKGDTGTNSYEGALVWGYTNNVFSLGQKSSGGSWEWKRVYHEGFKPTASDVGAVSKAGDTMTGDLFLKKGSPIIRLNDSRSTTANTGYIGFGSAVDTLQIVNSAKSAVLNISDTFSFNKGLSVGGGATFSADVYFSQCGNMRIGGASGWFGITNTANSAWVHKFNSDGSYVATGNITAYSDIKLKEDLEVIPDALNKIGKLNGYTYTRKDSGERQAGVVAQEVQAVLPEVITSNKDEKGEETLSVAYGNMVGLLIEGIKELKKENNELRALLREKGVI